MPEPVRLPTGPFGVIVADPPWHFASNSAARPGRNARRHYPTMRVPEIAALPVRDVAARDCLLLLWVTNPLLDQAMSVLDTWRFDYVSHQVWDKQALGTGYWTRSVHEICLIARRGRPYCPRPLFPRSIVAEKRREHSRKPEFVYQAINRHYPDARKLDLFARQERPGWVAFGDQVGLFAEGG
jgi:N6-adenosine-specific RNA methylase IME4